MTALLLVQSLTICKHVFIAGANAPCVPDLAAHDGFKITVAPGGGTEIKKSGKRRLLTAPFTSEMQEKTLRLDTFFKNPAHRTLLNEVLSSMK